MDIKVSKSRINGEINIPGSKSHTIRAIACAVLAEGKSEIQYPLESEDTISSLNAGIALGAKLLKKDKNIWVIEGTGGKILPPEKIINMGNSGTGLRIFTALAALSDREISFDGDSSLRSRPMSPLLDALKNLGVNVVSTQGKCPLTVCGPIKGGTTRVECKSSQYLTALLFATPLAQKDTLIYPENLNEIPYVEITLDWLGKTGIKIEYEKTYTLFKVFGRQKYKNFSCRVPADFSSATFPLLAVAITGGELKINNLDFNDKQGDKAVFDYFEKMGVAITKNNDGSVIVKSTGDLKGSVFDLNATPDALPAMAVAGCFAQGKTVLKNVAQARIKETDRIALMSMELRKLGAEIEELDDGMIIYGDRNLHNGIVEGHGDHRIIMALAIAGLRISGETIVKHADAVSVTYPSFIPDFKNINANLDVLVTRHISNIGYFPI